LPVAAEAVGAAEAEEEVVGAGVEEAVAAEGAAEGAAAVPVVRPPRVAAQRPG